MIPATFDANVLASGIAGWAEPASTPGLLMRAWRTRRFTLITSEHILQELSHTLAKRYFQARLAPDAVEEALRDLRHDTMLTPLQVEVHGVATHPEDDLVLAAAVSASADYLVTGARALLALGSYQGVKIVTPRQFLEVLLAEAAEER